MFSLTLTLLPPCLVAHRHCCYTWKNNNRNLYVRTSTSHFFLTFILDNIKNSTWRMLWYNFMKKNLSLHIFIIVKKKKKSQFCYIYSILQTLLSKATYSNSYTDGGGCQHIRSSLGFSKDTSTCRSG